MTRSTPALDRSFVLSCSVLLLSLSALAPLLPAHDGPASQFAATVGNHYGITANITYKVANGYEAKLDVYSVRNSEKPRPTVVYIHGGGWTGGSKEGVALRLMPYLQLGIIPEQHPERCRLFMQWKQMDWPILVDPLNLLGVSAVPITLAIDEYGIIRGKNLRVDAAAGLDETFLSKSFDPPAGSASRESAEQPAQPAAPSLEDLKPGPSPTIQAWRAYGAALVLWGGEDRLDEAIASYQRALELDPADGPTHFRLGVALRKRYDSARRQPNDFSAAVSQWRRALDIDPNQYIWRRRIQQYGPRLDKPYSFYDWVHQAREEIVARGEEPAPLRVEPGGAEFAHPAETFTSETSEPAEPDPRGRIHRDQEGFIRAETTIVPPVIRPGESARIHVVFRPNTAIKAHWNNEAGDLEYWLTPPEGWQADQQSLTVANPPALVSLEARKIEFELRCPDDAQPGQVQLSSYALYYVCEDVNGTCLYRRQDIQLPIEVTAGSP